MISNQRLVSVVFVALIESIACGESTIPDGKDEGLSIDTTSALTEQRQFAGAWSLARIERRDAEGELLSEPIEDRLGYIIYDAAGYMGVTIMHPDRIPYSENEPTADEALAQLGTYMSYFGRFTVNKAEGTVTHHLRGSLNPNGSGSDYKRFYSFTEGSMTLQPPPREDGSKTFLTWKRLTDLPMSELTDTHRKLFGAYRVESVSRHTRDGYALPADQYEAAYLLYAPSGHMSVYLMRASHEPYSGDRPTAEEALVVAKTYDSYFGAFSVREILGCITCPGPRDQGYFIHHRVGSVNPGGSGADVRSHYELTDSHLTLRPPLRTDNEGRQVQSVLRWMRLSPASAH
jgi:hypothetical protein